MSAMQELVAPTTSENCRAAGVSDAPVICCAIYGVIAKAQPPVWLPSFLADSLGVEKIQQELFVELEKEDAKFTNASAEAQPGKSWPKVVKAWLLGEIDGKEVSKRARKHISMAFHFPRWKAAGEAFEPEAAGYMVPLEDNVAALRACQKAGCTLVLSSNWRRDCLKPLAEQKATKEVIALFDEDKRFISEDLKLLTSHEGFFKKIKNKIGSERAYFYLDIALGQESLDAAQRAGMTPIKVSSETSLAEQLDALNVPSSK